MRYVARSASVGPCPARERGAPGAAVRTMVAGAPRKGRTRSPSADSASVARVDAEQAIRTRRTHKAYGTEQVPRATLDELFELARWAPNHNLTNPWRFRVVGPESLARLKEAAGPEAASKLDRAPTLIVTSVIESDDPIQSEEDLCAAAIASYIVLLGAHARGLAGYWRTPAVLRTDEGRGAVGVGDDERVLGLLHLGPPRQEKEPPERLPPGDFVTFLP
jgi:nitroreductase